MREFRVVTPADIDRYTEIYMYGYPSGKDMDDECFERLKNKTLREMELDQTVTFIGLYEDGELIATEKLIRFSMNLYGTMQPVYAIMALAVHPFHKKKGAALDLVKYAEDFAYEHGGLVNLLLPFNIGFYRRMGYGYGAKMDQYHIPTGALPGVDRGEIKHLTWLTTEDLPETLELYNAFAAKHHGMLERFEEEYRGMQEDTTESRVGYRDESGRLLGYLFFHFEPASEVNYTLNRIVVDEMIYEDGAVLQALLGFVKMQADLAQTVVLKTGDEDFYHVLESPQDVSGNYMDYGFLQTNVSAVGTMFKIMEPADFVEATAYREFPQAEPVIVEFAYKDEFQRYDCFLTVKFAEGRWELSEEPADVTLELKEADLASLLLGSCKLASMVKLGAIRISDKNYVKTLDRLLYVEQKPWSNADY